MVVDDFQEALKWHGNVVVMSVVQRESEEFSQVYGRTLASGCSSS